MSTLGNILAEKNYYEEKARVLWETLVMLKRDLDQHESKPEKLELSKVAWDEAIKRCVPFHPL